MIEYGKITRTYWIQSCFKMSDRCRFIGAGAIKYTAIWVASWLGCLTVILSPLAQAVQAAPYDVYEVVVPIDVTAKSAAVAKTEALANAAAEVAEAQLKVESLQEEHQQAKRAAPGPAAPADAAFREAIAKHIAAFKGKVEHDGFDESLGQLALLVDSPEKKPAADGGALGSTDMDLDAVGNGDAEGDDGFQFFESASAAAVAQSSTLSAEAKKRSADIMGEVAVAFRRCRAKTSNPAMLRAAPAPGAQAAPAGGGEGQGVGQQRS